MNISSEDFAEILRELPNNPLAILSLAIIVLGSVVCFYLYATSRNPANSSSENGKSTNHYGGILMIMMTLGVFGLGYVTMANIPEKDGLVSATTISVPESPNTGLTKDRTKDSSNADSASGASRTELDGELALKRRWEARFGTSWEE